MRLNPPKRTTFYISVLLTLIGVIAEVAPVAALAPYAFWFVVAGFVLLALGNLMEGL